MPWVVGILLAALAGVGAYLIFVRTHGAANAGGRDGAGGTGGRPTPVVAATARVGELPIYLNGLGTVTPFNLVTVRTRVGGEVMNVAFKEGQNVKAGDLLAEIDPRPFQVAVDQADAQLARDQAVLANAEADLRRYQSAAGSVPQQQIDTQVANVRQAEAVVKTDRAGVDNAKLQLSYCRIAAPFDGRIGLRRVDKGNIVQANDPTGLAVITQIQPIALIFSISQDDAATVLRKPGGGAGLVVDAFDRGFVNRLATGTVDAIDNQVDPATGTVRIKARFENADGTLFPNEFVNARLLVDTLTGAVIVPAAAVQRGPDGTFAYVVKADEMRPGEAAPDRNAGTPGVVDVRPVELGPAEGDRVAVTAGLSAGEVVVVDGVDKLRPGAKVVARERGTSTAGRAAAPAAAGTTTQPAAAIDAGVPDRATQPAGVGGGRRGRPR